MDAILSFDSLKRSNFQSVAMVFVLQCSDAIFTRPIKLKRFRCSLLQIRPRFYGFQLFCNTSKSVRASTWQRLSLSDRSTGVHLALKKTTSQWNVPRGEGVKVQVMVQGRGSCSVSWVSCLVQRGCQVIDFKLITIYQLHVYGCFFGSGGIK